MAIGRFIAAYAGLGLLIPLVFRAAWHFIDQGTNLKAGIIVERLMLMLWPTSLMTLPTSDEPGFETKLFLISLGANVVFYALVGFLIWLGLRKHVGFFVIPILLLPAMWWWLLTR